MIKRDRVPEFIALWNASSVATVAKTFGITHNYASVVACELRQEGHMLELRSENQRFAMPTEDQRSALDHMLLSLCFMFSTAPKDVLGTGKLQDGRTTTRRALAYAGKKHLKMSWKCLGIYFGRNHSSCAGWVKEAKRHEREAAARVYAEWTLRDKGEFALEAEAA